LNEEPHDVDVKPADELGDNDLDNQDDQNGEDIPDDLNLEDDGFDETENQEEIKGDSMSSDCGEEEGNNDNEKDEEIPLLTENENVDLTNEQNIEQDESDVQSNPDDEAKSIKDEEDEKKESANGFNESIPEDPIPNEDTETQPNQNDSHVDQNTQPFGIEGDGEQMIQNQSDYINQGGHSAADSPDQKEIEDGVDQAKNSNEDSKNSPAPSSNEPNPHRSVGSATEKWLSRLRNISDRIDDAVPQESIELDEENVKDKEFEFVKDNDDDQGNAQALGEANEDQLQDLSKGVADDEEMLNDIQNDDLMSEDDSDHQIEAPDYQTQQQESQANHNLESKKSNTKIDEDKEKLNRNEKMENNDEKQDEKEISIDSQKIENSQFIRNSKEIPEDEAEYMDIDDVPSSIVDYDQLRHDLEIRMAKWRLEGHHKETLNSMELWRKYTNLTRDYSFHLCEQLRLILEPTLSTKLKGDYRTGKRLNLRKIIPYIASQFKKDKIWLRRTKPSKRTYQIMLAIDDSMSMSNSHSVQLAFEALTLISNALNQLEVGEIGVISFGSDVKLLHPFEKAWSDEAGANVLSLFTFAQESTKVKHLMDQSIAIMNYSRALQQNNELWQLQIIISDGICEDHDYIKSRVRSAAEDHIAMVFIVLDTRSERDSITNMTSISYESDPNTGVPILKMDKYMDSFPFDFYVIVRNVEKLPEVLGDTIRQFFMLFQE
jgi:midasin